MQKHNIQNISKLLLILSFSLIFNGASYAASKTEIDIKVSASLEKFRKEVLGAEKFIEKVKFVYQTNLNLEFSKKKNVAKDIVKKYN